MTYAEIQELADRIASTAMAGKEPDSDLLPFRAEYRLEGEDTEFVSWIDSPLLPESSRRLFTRKLVAGELIPESSWKECISF